MLWIPYTATDAMQDREPVKYICEGLFSLPSLSILYGPPGSLKSLLMMDLTVCIASGTNWLQSSKDDNDTSRKVIQSPVLWIDYDNGKRRVDERFAALLKARNLSTDVPLYYVSMMTPWLDMSKEDNTDKLIDFAKQLNIKFIVIDNLGVVSGGVEETSSNMIHVMSNFRKLTESTGAAIVIIHHQRKSRKDDSELREGDKLRGHSSIEAALDLALIITRKGQSDQIMIRSTKTRDVDVPDFNALWSCEHKSGTFDLDTAIFFGQKATMSIEDAVMTLLIKNVTMNQKSLVKQVAHLTHAGENRIRKEILEMTIKQKIITEKSDKNASIYHL
jgi:archaellum biogenesis ATPase FlaH